MDRRSVIKNAGLAGVLAAGVAPAVHAQAAIRWRLSSSFPKALDTIHGAADVFAKKVNEMSGGKFTVTVHAPGELVPAFGVVDAVQQGVMLTEADPTERSVGYGGRPDRDVQRGRRAPVDHARGQRWPAGGRDRLLALCRWTG